MMHGQGKLKWPEEVACYSGQFKEDKRDGYGEYIYNYGSRTFRGYWKSDKQHGIGFVAGDLEIKARKGLWEEGKLVKWIVNNKDNIQNDCNLLKQDSLVTVHTFDKNEFEMEYSQQSSTAHISQVQVESPEKEKEKEIPKTVKIAQKVIRKKIDANSDLEQVAQRRSEVYDAEEGYYEFEEPSD